MLILHSSRIAARRLDSIGVLCANNFLVLRRNVIVEHAIRSSDSNDHSTKWANIQEGIELLPFEIQSAWTCALSSIYFTSYSHSSLRLCNKVANNWTTIDSFVQSTSQQVRRSLWKLNNIIYSPETYLSHGSAHVWFHWIYSCTSSFLRKPQHTCLYTLNIARVTNCHMILRWASIFCFLSHTIRSVGIDERYLLIELTSLRWGKWTHILVCPGDHEYHN